MPTRTLWTPALQVAVVIVGIQLLFGAFVVYVGYNVCLDECNVDAANQTFALVAAVLFPTLLVKFRWARLILAIEELAVIVIGAIWAGNGWFTWSFLLVGFVPCGFTSVVFFLSVRKSPMHAHVGDAPATDTE